MPKLIEKPTRIQAAGTKPKLIDEYAGRVNNGEERLSVAHMRSPSGWVEPGQRPDFDEYTLVLRGLLRVEHEAGVLEVRAGQAVLAKRGSGCATARPTLKAPNTSLSACRRSRSTPSTATRRETSEPTAAQTGRKKKCAWNGQPGLTAVTCRRPGWAGWLVEARARASRAIGRTAPDCAVGSR